MNTPEWWSAVVPLIGLAIPATLALAAAASRRTSPARAASVASGVVVGLALLFTVGAALGQGASPRGAPMLGVRVDLVTCVMLLLVSSIGLVIARYSRTYLQGDPGLPRYFRWLLLTLTAVTSLVIANNLLVVAMAWTATSLALHQLLTFYSDRPAALVAAHKKFLVSRLADVSLWACLALVQLNVGSLELDRIADWADAHPPLTLSMHVAAVLLVITVALKSAQLPFHGWLTQVMEAPTPVSAVLHAGVVNIGGLVMIRLAPWLAHEATAQLLLVVIGLVTAVVAALVMTTRVSVKVALAWSTCAQMGFMLVQCGLGAWHLALLHLVAHSLYKAHAFLSAGTAVEQWRLQTLMAPGPRASWRTLGLSTLVALGSAAACVALLVPAQPRQAADLSVLVLALLVGLSLVPMLARRGPAGPGSRVALAASAVAVASLYVVWHVAAARLVPGAHAANTSNAVGWVVVGLAFTALFAVKATLALRPEGRLARAWYPWLYAGLYLDERFTRLTFRLWPPRLQPRQAANVVQRAGVVEAGA